jgi:hypothetical protein
LSNDDIVYTIISQAKVARLREKIETLRRGGGVRSADLQRLARQVGRRPHARGKEPTWVNVRFPEARPLSIPGHRELIQAMIEGVEK